MNLLLCLPTFNPPREIFAALVAELQRHYPYPILVVDDGSEPPLSIPPGNHRVTLIRQETNCGKGVAIQKAFSYAAAHGFTHVLTLDADGQHPASELAKLIAASKQNPSALVIGKRRFSGNSIPKVSVFGRQFSNFWVRYVSQQTIQDSQSGLRLYPTYAVQTLNFRCHRYDFEIEVLNRLLWRGVPVMEPEVEVVYFPEASRVSHFHKLWDNCRITFLNLILIFLSLLRFQRAPANLALSVGVGVFIGCSPLFGLHTLLALATAFLFKLHFGLLWLGTQVSIPPLIPFLTTLEISVGKQLLPHASIPIQWGTGSVPVGMALGLFAGGLTYALLKRRKTMAFRQGWNGRNRGGRLGNAFMKAVIRRLGVSTGNFLLLFIIPYFYLFAPTARKSLKEYWLVIEPDLPWYRLPGRVLKHLYHFGQVLVDKLFQSGKKNPCFASHGDGMHHIIDGVKAGKGLILLSAHTGSWDMAAQLLESHGLSSTFHQVQFLGEKQVEPIKTGKVAVIPTNEPQPSGRSMMEIYARLRAGEPVGFLVDRVTSKNWVWATLFGKVVPIEASPFLIAATTGCPVIVTFGFRKPGSFYQFYASPPKIFEKLEGDKLGQVQGWVDEFCREWEMKLREYPTQWFNFFPFFSQCPAKGDA